MPNVDLTEAEWKLIQEKRADEREQRIHDDGFNAGLRCAYNITHLFQQDVSGAGGATSGYALGVVKARIEKAYLCRDRNRDGEPAQ